MHKKVSYRFNTKIRAKHFARY